jgi:hypothetical protein
MAADVVGEALDLIFGRIDRRMRIREKQIDAFKFGAVGASSGGEPKHSVEINGRLRIRTLAHETGPHGVMEFRVVVARHAFLPFVASGRSPNALAQRASPTACLSNTLVSSAEKEARLGGHAFRGVASLRADRTLRPLDKAAT